MSQNSPVLPGSDLFCIFCPFLCIFDNNEKHPMKLTDCDHYYYYYYQQPSYNWTKTAHFQQERMLLYGNVL